MNTQKSNETNNDQYDSTEYHSEIEILKQWILTIILLWIWVMIIILTIFNNTIFGIYYCELYSCKNTIKNTLE